MSVPNARRSASVTSTTKAASPTASKRWDCRDRPTGGTDGRLRAEFKVSKQERLLGMAMPEERIVERLSSQISRPLIESLLNAGRHTIDLTYDSEYSHLDRCDTHAIEADLCPVEMRRMTMACREPPAPVWSPPPTPPPPPPPPPPPETLSQHAYRVLAAWGREMISEVEYDGPRG